MKIYMVLKSGKFKMSAIAGTEEHAVFLAEKFSLERVSYFEYLAYKLFKRVSK